MEEAAAKGMETSDEDENDMVYCSGACMLLSNCVPCIMKEQSHATVHIKTTCWGVSTDG